MRSSRTRSAQALSPRFIRRTNRHVRPTLQLCKRGGTTIRTTRVVQIVAGAGSWQLLQTCGSQLPASLPPRPPGHPGPGGGGTQLFAKRRFAQ